MGEFELLAEVRKRLGAAGPRVRLGSGDDAAVTVPGGATATSVDALVEGVHFRRETAGLAAIGHKALATALSDLAAMGAEAGEAYVVLGLPDDLDEAGCLELVEGMAALAERTGTTIAGGDLSRSPVLSLAVTVVGHAPAAGRFVARAGARPGDVLALTGELGGAAGGLLLLERPQLGEALPAAVVAALRRRQLLPRPRLAAGAALAAAGATALIDISDGLGADAGHLAAAGGVKLTIEASSLPLAEGLAAVAGGDGRDPLALAAAGGEDYELLAALPAERFEDAAAAVAAGGETRLTRIGEVRDGSGVEIRLRDGGTLEPAGFDQLARRARAAP